MAAPTRVDFRDKPYKPPHWLRWLNVESRCVVPFNSFSENEVLADGSRPPVWFALSEERPLAFFAGIWTTWTSVRKVKKGETPLYRRTGVMDIVELGLWEEKKAACGRHVLKAPSQTHRG